MMLLLLLLVYNYNTLLVYSLYSYQSLLLHCISHIKAILLFKRNTANMPCVCWAECFGDLLLCSDLIVVGFAYTEKWEGVICESRVRRNL